MMQEALSKVTEITFFEDRALVLRDAEISLPVGRVRVRVPGLSLLVDDRSLSVTASVTSARVVQAKVHRHVQTYTHATAVELQALQQGVDDLRGRIGEVDLGLQRARAEVERCKRLLGVYAQAAASVPSRASEARAEMRAAYEAIERAWDAALATTQLLQTERGELERNLSLNESRLAQGRIKKPRYVAEAEIELDVLQAGVVSLSIAYRLPCALWRPSHVVMLDDQANELSIVTYASVWQRTGEDWSNVRCRFSTARPAEEASPPILTDDVLSTRKKSDDERKRVVVEAREQAIQKAGAAGVRDADEMPGVDDGGEPQWLVAPAPATVESDGRPCRIELGRRRVPCTTSLVCFPELSETTHLRAQATLRGQGPLLPGPVAVGRGNEITGRGQLKFVGPGEPFELSLGADARVTVRRRVDEERKTTAVTGTQHVERKVHGFVSNTSAERVRLRVIERVPVSEIEDLVVHVADAPGLTAEGDARDGFYSFGEVELGAGESREFTLVYRLEAKSNVVLPD
jgi:uncharacterized protein (TIGR02231 family)